MSNSQWHADQSYAAELEAKRKKQEQNNAAAAATLRWVLEQEINSFHMTREGDSWKLEMCGKVAK